MNNKSNNSDTGGRTIQRFYDGKTSIYANVKSTSTLIEQTVLQMFPETPNLRILDYGCNTGHFAKTLKVRGHNVIGMDISDTAVQQARAAGIHAVTGNAELNEGLRELEGKYDIITLLDVLEHTFNPEIVLTNLAGWLQPSGCIIVSIPNIGCIAGRLTILAGHFPRQEQGLFDNGHIRWFTKSSFLTFINNIGVLTVADIKGIPIPAINKAGLWRVENLQNHCLRRLARYCPSLWGYQLVCKLTHRLDKDKSIGHITRA